MELNQVVGIITGGAAGFGRAFAEKVLSNGGKVMITDVNVHGLQLTGKALESKYGHKNVCWMRQDVTERESFAHVFDYASKFFAQPINLLINNAGIAGDLSFYDGLSTNWESVVEIDLTALIRGTQYAIVQFQKTLNGREGVIVNIASMAGLNSTPFSPEYAAAKSGVVGFTRSLLELKQRYNIRSFAMCPGFADTNMGRDAVDQIPKYTDAMGGLMPIDTVAEAFAEGLREPDNCGRVQRIMKTKRAYYRFPGDKLLFPNSKL
jgi:NAD(P)-dependent dehydrogenase (short-subunit alcohol dehydrogenase family)